MRTSAANIPDTDTWKCKGCGCTTDSACVTKHGPCYWVRKDWCSGCEAYTEIAGEARR